MQPVQDAECVLQACKTTAVCQTHRMFWMLMDSASCTVCQQPPVSILKYTSSAGAAEPCTAMMMMPPWSPTCPSEQRQECSAAGVLEVASQYVSFFTRQPLHRHDDDDAAVTATGMLKARAGTLPCCIDVRHLRTRTGSQQHAGRGRRQHSSHDPDVI